QNECPWKPWC
uniref:Contryphan-Ar3 n=1 Tax=Conus araneosus TaxID=101286 RepID=COW3_CONAO|nr:RecName: Full=Contryphan-Ar3; AltName: Full=Ar1286; AltName: Full=Ar1330 [Conus araneosus]